MFGRHWATRSTGCQSWKCGDSAGSADIRRSTAGAEYKIDFVPKIRLEIVCKDEDAENLIAIICESARTGKIGDGKIFISDMSDIIRIRTGERGEEVI